MALALYRRYRPDTFDKVIGQDQVTVPLMHALDSGRLTHAYLFSGPRGCGKTSSARILARCINCEQGPTSHPCGVCASCRDLATGGPGSIDVVEIDAASHNGVEDARELRERAGFAPARDRYKIFILDEAHMVTQQGFNALLKIVEEPPEHVMFIFATTEPDKVIGTIRSRTHHYPFRLVPQEIMGPFLEQICEDEGIRADKGVLRLAMRAGGGSVRDTLSVLDQLMVAAVDDVIGLDAAIALLGFTPDELITKAIDCVIDGDGAGLYSVVQQVIVGGYDPRRFVEDLLARVRDLLVLTLGGEQAEHVLGDESSETMEDLHRQAAALGLQPLTQIAQTINDSLAHMSGTVSPRMRLELLAARLLALHEAGYAQPMAAVAAGADGQHHAANGGAAHSNAQNANGRVSHGFIGSSRNQSSTQHEDAQASASATAQTPVTSATPEVHTSAAANTAAATNTTDSVSGWPSLATATDTSASTTSSATSETALQMGVPAATAANSANTDAQSVDERWDALVAQLPDDVQQYVNRTKVPRINYTQDARTGHDRLWIKFDTALSKYAFALAVAEHEVDGSSKVVDILRARVHEVFGEHVSLAPTQKMADGQTAPAWSHLSTQEQSRIKAQLVQSNMQALASLSNMPGISIGMPTDASRDSHDTAAAHETADHTASDDDADRSAYANAHVAASLDEDPWAQPLPSTYAASPFMNDAAPQTHTATPAPASPAPSASHVTPMADPWMQAIPAATPLPDADEDPWAVPAQSYTPASAPAMPEPAHEQAFGAAHTNAPAVQSTPANATATESSDDDEYSIYDQSLGSNTEVSVEDLKKMFDVKSVEQFAADDPKNPKNAHHKKKNTEE